MLTNREIMQKVIDFDDAPRIGYNLREHNGEILKGYNDLIGNGFSKLEGFDYEWHKAADFADRFPYLKDFNGFARYDEFGNLWGKMIQDPSPMGEVLEGAIEDWSQLSDYQLPNFTEISRYTQSKELFLDIPSQYRMGYLPGFPFAIMRKIRKMDAFLMDLILEREKVDTLNDMVVDMLLKVVDNYASIGADAIMFCEDWGTQKRLLVSPTMWREIFKPGYVALCKRAHDKGMKVFMHSCGYIYEIIDDLIEVGIDVFQFDQPSLMGMDRLSEKFTKHKKVLFSSCDIQKVLPTGDKDLIQAHARDLIKKFSSHGGGYLAKDYGDYATIQVSKQSIDWMHEVFIKEGNK